MDESKVEIALGESESIYKLAPRVTISDNSSEIFCVRFSPDGKFLAAGCGGTIKDLILIRLLNSRDFYV